MGAGLAAEFIIGARAQRFLDDFDVEQQVSEHFREACDLVGFAEANRIFDERGLNTDKTPSDKAFRARKVVGEIRERCRE